MKNFTKHNWVKAVAMVVVCAFLSSEMGWTEIKTSHLRQKWTAVQEAKPEAESRAPSWNYEVGFDGWKNLGIPYDKMFLEYGYIYSNMAVDENGNIFIATDLSYAILKISPDGKFEKWQSIDVGRTHDLAVTDEHIFVATNYGIYVYNRYSQKLDKELTDEGIINLKKA